MTRELINSDEMVSERSVRDTKVIRGRVLKVPRRNAGNAEVGNELARETKGGGVKNC